MRFLLPLFLLAPTAVSQEAESLSWMAGTWGGVKDGVENEECWTAPRGGALLGMHRDVRAGRMVGFEFLRIQTEKDGLTYWASPGGETPTPFRLKERGARRVVFENPAHDFPQRILYWLGDDGKLNARIEGTLQGKPDGEEWSWTRIAP
jgi:Domain of unknown function (DUF6265)